jgi:peptide/nickel transport system substrate-binding protein
LLAKIQFKRRLIHLALATLPLTAAAQDNAQPPVEGGTLTYAVSQEPTSLVSFLDTKTDDRNVSAKVTEGLLRYDAKFNPQPLLATSWKVSADGLTYSFKLRPGVKWHDGRDFTAEDVRYAVLMQKKQGPRGRITLANVERVDAPDPLTAVIVLSKPAPFLIKSLSSADLRAALARVGIKVEVVDGDLPTFLKRVYTTRDLTSTSTAWAGCLTRRWACSASTGATACATR